MFLLPPRASWTECWRKLEERYRISVSIGIRNTAQWYTWRGEPKCWTNLVWRWTRQLPWSLLGKENTTNSWGARNVRQDERLALACAAKEYLRRISIIWSSPLSDCNRIQATNQYALPVLRYLMWTQHWPLSELRDVDRAARKIIVEYGGKFPASLTSLLYLPREKGGRGLRSVEH